MISVGEIKAQHILDAESEYLKRLKKFVNIDIREISTRKLSGFNESERKRNEAKLLHQAIKPDTFLVILDENGQSYSSPKFASFLERHMLEGNKRIVFAIGGVFGWDNQVRERAQATLSLSRMTFTFELTRLVLIEQIYRGITIIKGIPYHKGNLTDG